MENENETSIMMDEPIETAVKQTIKKVLLSINSIVIVVIAAAWISLNFVHPFERPFDITDKDISYPKLPDIVPIWWVIVAALVIPFLVVGAITRNGFQTVLFYHRYIFGILLHLLITEIIKLTAGRLRPDFLDRCKPNASGTCTGNTAEIIEGRKSFYSGHSSTSFFFITYTMVWMLDVGWKRLGLRVGRRKTSAAIILLTVAPFMIPTYVAISRTQQYIHHPTDVITGSLFGILSAYFVYVYHI